MGSRRPLAYGRPDSLRPAPLGLPRRHSLGGVNPIEQRDSFSLRRLRG